MHENVKQEDEEQSTFFFCIYNKIFTISLEIYFYNISIFKKVWIVRECSSLENNDLILKDFANISFKRTINYYFENYYYKND